MSRKSYPAALDAVLKPMGFLRVGKVWSRTVGAVLDEIDLQTSSIAGTTANLWSKDLETERMLASIACEIPVEIVHVGTRIGQLVDGRDRWWRNDPDGPAQLAEAVRAHGLPWLDGFRTLEDQAKRYGRENVRPWRSSSLPVLAITLYRLGALEEALALFEAPVPKTTIPSLVVRCRCVQRWLESQKKASKRS